VTGAGPAPVERGMLRRAADLEIGVWRSLYRWVRRRPLDLPEGTTAHPYAAGVAPLMWVFIGMSAVEIPIMHLLLPAGWWRAGALILGAWGVLWMIGLLASMHVHPHLVDPDGLRLRYGSGIDVTVPWSAIDSVNRRSRNLPSSRTVQVDPGDGADACLLVVNSQTDVDIRLREPISLSLRRCPDPVLEIRCYADDPAAFVAAARGHLLSGS
jgi:hypothetical protein